LEFNLVKCQINEIPQTNKKWKETFLLFKTVAFVRDAHVKWKRWQ
jgi:hypothetical protein